MYLSYGFFGLIVVGAGAIKGRYGENSEADAGGGCGELSRFHCSGRCVARDPGGGFLYR